MPWPSSHARSAGPPHAAAITDVNRGSHTMTIVGGGSAPATASGPAGEDPRRSSGKRTAFSVLNAGIPARAYRSPSPNAAIAAASRAAERQPPSGDSGGGHALTAMPASAASNALAATAGAHPRVGASTARVVVATA